MGGRLNSFQRTMLQWNAQHPYNAVHVVRLAGPLETERLRGAISRVLALWGVGGWRMQRGAFFEYVGGSGTPELVVLAGSGADLLAGEVERQLNARFVLNGVVVPFRFFAVEGGDSFHLGLAYFHVCADAESVVRMLQAVAGFYTGDETAERDRPAKLYPATRDWLMLGRPSSLWRLLWNLPRQAGQMRRAYRPRYRDLRETTNRYRQFAIGREGLGALSGASKRIGVTVNDLLLALLLKALAPLAEGRLKADRRRRLAVGSIVNIRRDIGEEEGQTFGLRLGSFVVSHEVPEGLEVEDLAVAVGRQTRLFKQARLYLAMPMQLALARFALGLFSTGRRLSFYQKHYPLWAGITNMNLNALWNRSPAPLAYFRAVSTGPVTPMVLSATTWGEELQVGLSYRTTVFSEREVDQVQAGFVGLVDQLKMAAA